MVVHARVFLLLWKFPDGVQLFMCDKLSHWDLGRHASASTRQRESKFLLPFTVNKKNNQTAAKYKNNEKYKKNGF